MERVPAHKNKEKQRFYFLLGGVIIKGGRLHTYTYTYAYVEELGTVPLLRAYTAFLIECHSKRKSPQGNLKQETYRKVRSCSLIPPSPEDGLSRHHQRDPCALPWHEERTRPLPFCHPDMPTGQLSELQFGKVRNTS